MKKGDKVVCIDNDANSKALTVGEEYEVLAVRRDLIDVMDDDRCRTWFFCDRFKLTPQSILIDGEETYLATAEELAKDWEGKAIQYMGKWFEIVGIGVDTTNDRSKFYMRDRRIVWPWTDEIIPYRLVNTPATKTLRSVVQEATGNVDAIVSAIEEHFEIKSKQGETK